MGVNKYPRINTRIDRALKLRLDALACEYNANTSAIVKRSLEFCVINPQIVLGERRKSNKNNKNKDS